MEPPTVMRRVRAAGRRTHRRGAVARTTVAALALAASSAGLAATPADAVAAACNGGNGVTVTSLNAPHFYVDSGVSPALTSGYAGYDVVASAARHDLWVQLSGFTGGALALGPSQPSSLPLGATAASAHTPAFFLLTASAASTTAQTHTVQVWSGRPGAAGSTLVCSTTGGFGAVEETIKASANKVQDVTGDGTAVTVSTSTPRLGGSVSVSVEGVTGTIGAGTSADPNGLYMTPTALSSWPAGAFRLTSTRLLISPDGTSPAQTYSDLLHLAPLSSASRSYTATYTFTVTGTTSTGSQLYPVQQIASGTQIKHTDTSSFSTLIPAIPAATNPLTVGLTGTPGTLPAAGGVAHLTIRLASTAATTSIADVLQAQLPAGASYVPGSTTLGGTAAPDPATSAGLLSWTGPFSTSSSAPTDLHFDVSLPSGAATYPVTASGLLGSTVLDTTADTTDSSPASLTLTVPATDVQAQTIDFPALPDTRVDATAPTLAASATSGLPVTYDVSTPSVCTVSGGTLTLVAPGTCTVTASQAGDSTWAAAAPVDRSFQVTSTPPPPPPPAAQTITFPALADTELGTTPPTLAATATSGLPVTYDASTTPSVCTVSGGTLTLLTTGTCRVTASQAGDTTWAAATPVSRSFTVTAHVVTPPIVAPPYVTSGVGTTVQSAAVTVPAGYTITLLDAGHPVTTITEAGQGTYTLVSPSTGTSSPSLAALESPAARSASPFATLLAAVTPAPDRIDFAPRLGFVGTATPATYRLTSPTGQTVTATYTPTVTVPAAPPSAPKSTTSTTLATQSTTVPVPPGGSVTLLDQGRPVLSLTIAGEGTYTVDPATGVLTFTPLPTFTGTAQPATYRVTDAYGQSTVATYVATVVPGSPVPTTPPPTTPPPTAPGAGTPVTRPVAPPLAHTGTDLGPLLSAATGLLLLGAALTRLPHRRRRR